MGTNMHTPEQRGVAAHHEVTRIGDNLPHGTPDATDVTVTASMRGREGGWVGGSEGGREVAA